MATDARHLGTAERVTPRALLSYAKGLGWKRVSGLRRPEVAVLHRPDSELHQVIIPIDPDLVDYGDAVHEAVQKLADFERRPANEVLEHLLLPPADFLHFREESPDAEAGNLPFEHAVRLITGVQRLLLSAAHSVLVPQPFHPRLSRSEAEEFLSRCRLGQTERGSFILNIACPLDQPIALPGIEAEPFARRVTEQMMQSLEALERVAETGDAGELFDLNRLPGMSANLCESLLLLRPAGDRARLTVSAVWSRAWLPPSGEPSRSVQLRQEVFEVAESVAPKLRAIPEPKELRFFGYVDALRGQPGRDDPRPRGEVDFMLFDDQEGELHARGFLDVAQYALAGAAHLESDVVSFKGTLRRLPRMSRIEAINELALVRIDAKEERPATSIAK